MACINLGVVGYKRANYNRASEYLSRSLHIGREEDDLDIQTHSNIALGNVHRLQRDYEAARKHLHTAYNQAQELGFPREEALALEFLGDVYRDEQRPGEARRFYQRAMAIGKRIAPKGDIVMEVHRRLGECHNLEHEPGKARRELLAGLKLAQAQGDRYEEAVILRILGEAQILLADLAGAADYIQQATDLLDQIGARHELAIALMRLAEIRLAQVDSPQDEHESNDASLTPQSLLTEAWQHANQALEQFIPVGVAWWTERCRVLAERIANRRAEMAARSARSNAKTSRNEHIIIHASLRMRDLLQMCDSLAVSNEPVLIRGETGTGKELIARRLHAHSSRSGRDLVTVNVAAIPASMFEREFFGHVRGAFSGADRDKAGFAAAADGGTLFLDEIGELPMELQPKLLRLLQNGTYQALGDPRERHTDIRLVAATNADLEQAVRAGTFRSDLYFRLKVLQLGVPPLRDRTEDIIPLLRHFLSEAAGQQVEIGTYFAEKALAVMASYDWPGNVRELAMVARQAHLQRSTLGRIEIELERTGRTNLVIHGSEQRELACNAPSPSFNEATERAAILRALAETNGVRTDAARRLGMARSTLYRAMERLGIAGKTKPPHRS